MDPFRALGIEPRFSLNLALAEQNWRALSKTLHPDRHVGAPSAQRIDALGRAIELNDAWRIVKDPLRRAEAILSLRGALNDEQEMPKPSPELLMEMMDIRETLSAATHARDAVALTALRSALDERKGRILEALDRELDGPIAKALGSLAELKYIMRALTEVEAAEESLDA